MGKTFLSYYRMKVFARGKEMGHFLRRPTERLSFPLPGRQAGVGGAFQVPPTLGSSCRYVRKRPGAHSRDLGLRPAFACTPAAMPSSPPVW